MTTALPKFELHSSFDSWGDVDKAFKIYCDETHQPLIKRSAKRVKTDAGEKVCLYQTYACTHRGVFNSRGKGLRDTKSVKDGCMAKIHASLNKNSNKVVITALQAHHNHEIGPELYRSYVKQRGLTKDEREVTMNLLQMNMPVKVIRQQLCLMTGKDVTKQDVQNVRKQYRYDFPTKMETTELDDMNVVLNEVELHADEFENRPNNDLKTLCSPCRGLIAVQREKGMSLSDIEKLGILDGMPVTCTDLSRKEKEDRTKSQLRRIQSKLIELRGPAFHFYMQELQKIEQRISDVVQFSTPTFREAQNWCDGSMNAGEGEYSIDVFYGNDHNKKGESVRGYNSSEQHIMTIHNGRVTEDSIGDQQYLDDDVSMVNQHVTVNEHSYVVTNGDKQQAKVKIQSRKNKKSKKH